MLTIWFHFFLSWFQKYIFNNLKNNLKYKIFIRLLMNIEREKKSKWEKLYSSKDYIKLFMIDKTDFQSRDSVFKLFIIFSGIDIPLLCNETIARNRHRIVRIIDSNIFKHHKYQINDAVNLLFAQLLLIDETISCLHCCHYRSEIYV